jgi:hypothetical protein
MTSTVEAEDAPVSGRTTTIAGRWLGPCVADQRPADVVSPALPNGARLNILDLMKWKGPLF